MGKTWCGRSPAFTNVSKRSEKLEESPPKDKILGLLADVVGAENVSNDPAVLVAYSRDQHWPVAPPHMPDYVVRAGTKEEVQNILRVANRYRIPVIPMSSGLNIRGLCIPTYGGIILDLKRMDFMEIDEEMMTATVGPGVNCATLADEAEKKGLRPLIPGAPSTVAVLSNFLLRGVSNLGPKYGNTGDQVLGMEVVLPTGELLYTGSAAFPNVGPNYRYFGPDLAGLFQGQPGIMGVVTKMTVKLHPLPEHQEFLICGWRRREGEEPEGALKRATAFTHSMMKHDPPLIALGAIMHWMSAGIMMVDKREDIPEFKGAFGDWVFLASIEGTREFVAYAHSVIEKIIKEHKSDMDEGGEILPMGKAVKDELRAARRIYKWFRLGNYYALAWWGPLNRSVDYFFKSLETWQKLGIPEELSMVALPVYPYQGQCCYFELDSFWDATNKEVTEKIKEFTKRMYDKLVDEVGIYCWFRPYPGVVETTFPKLKGVMPELWWNIKKLLDPNNIMNPGKIFPP